MRILLTIALAIALTACSDPNAGPGQVTKDKLVCKVGNEVSMESGLASHWSHNYEGEYYSMHPSATYTPRRGELCEIVRVKTNRKRL